jgi:ABC-2 type transport system ATP-binding protein
MYVRLGFSVAINVDPDVLLVDEVLAVGDESFQRRCGEKFAELRAAGKTIVVVSHALETVRTLCDTVAWLEHGVLMEVGPPGAVIDRYVGVSHQDRTDDGDGGSRWGSGEGRIDRLELIGPDGQPTHKVRTGDKVIVRMHYSTTGRVERPVFGIGIASIAGVLAAGPNTREVDLVPDAIEGEGVVDLTIDSLPLLVGTYDLSVSMYDYTCQHPFDHRHNAMRFDVEAGVPRQVHGLVVLGGSWTVDGATVATTPSS